MNRPNLYMVGGAVRDLLLFQDKAKSAEADFVLETNSWDDLMEYVSGCAYQIYESNPDHGTAKINLDGVTANLSLMKGYSLQEDLKSRDFTINAMAIKVGASDSFRALYDPLNGAEDLRRGTIRMCSKQTFKKDPIRILRMLRFLYTLGVGGIGCLDSKTLQEARATASTLSYEQVSSFSEKKTLKVPDIGEVVQEFNKIFKILPDFTQKVIFLSREEVDPFLRIPGVDLKFVANTVDKS